MNPWTLAITATAVALALAAIAAAACWWATALRARLKAERARRRQAEERLAWFQNVPEHVATSPAFFLAGLADLPAADVAACIADLERHANGDHR
jgi:hypothetical protein